MIQATIFNLNGAMITGTRMPDQASMDAWLTATWPPSDQYTVTQEDITQQLADAKVQQDAHAYLTSTDWMVIRQMDNGAPVPQDVKDQRQQARLTINPVQGI